MGTSLSAARLKAVTTLGAALVVAVAPFPALAPGEFENFCFDFTADTSAASIASTKWIASFDPGNMAASDANPQARVITASAATLVYFLQQHKPYSMDRSGSKRLVPGSVDGCRPEADSRGS